MMAACTANLKHGRPLDLPPECEFAPPSTKKLLGVQREQVKEDIQGLINDAVDYDRREAMDRFCSHCPGDGEVCFSGDGYCPEAIEFVAKDDFWFDEESQERVVGQIMDIATFNPSPRLKNFIRGIVGKISVRKSLADAIIDKLTVTIKPSAPKPTPPTIPTKCPICAAQGIESKIVPVPKFESQFLGHQTKKVVVGISHYTCEACDHNIYPKIAGSNARYNNRKPSYEGHEWPKYIELGTRKKGGFQEWQLAIDAIAARGALADWSAGHGVTSPVFAKLQPTITSVAKTNGALELLYELVKKVMHRPVKRVRHEPERLDNRGKAQETVCDECGGHLTVDRGHGDVSKTGELYCIRCGLVSNEIFTTPDTPADVGYHNEAGQNMPGVSKATQDFEKEHNIGGWKKQRPATRKKSKNIVRLQVIVAENLDKFFGGWSSLGLNANRQLLRKLYAEKHGKVLDDTTLWRYVPEITPIEGLWPWDP